VNLEWAINHQKIEKKGVAGRERALFQPYRKKNPVRTAWGLALSSPKERAEAHFGVRKSIVLPGIAKKTRFFFFFFEKFSEKSVEFLGQI
jgi:hypothetical protein